MFTRCLRPAPPRSTGLLRGGAIVAALALGACTTYPDRVQRTADAVGRGELGTGVVEMSRAARVSNAAQMPRAAGGRDAGLALLERGSLLLAMQRWQYSSRDLRAAAASLEVLDRGAAGTDLGQAVYGLPAGSYSLTPTEHLNLAALDLLNHLASDDLESARNAARDFTIARRKQHDLHGGIEVAPHGSYLAGFALEKLGEADLAVAYYEEALEGRDFPSLVVPLGKLTLESDYRAPRTTAYALDPDADSGNTSDAEVLVVVLTGRAPGRVAELVPVPTAMAEAGGLADGTASAVNRSGVRTVAYPALEPAGNHYDDARLRVDGKDIRLDSAAEPGAEIAAEHAATRPRVLAAALDRVARGLRADRPDTRSWTNLPDRVLVSRVPMPAGPHTIEVETTGPAKSTWHRRDVRVEAGGYRVVVFSTLQ